MLHGKNSERSAFSAHILPAFEKEFKKKSPPVTQEGILFFSEGQTQHQHDVPSGLRVIIILPVLLAATAVSPSVAIRFVDLIKGIIDQYTERYLFHKDWSRRIAHTKIIHEISIDLSVGVLGVIQELATNIF
jgi:hypothetical protein